MHRKHVKWKAIICIDTTDTHLYQRIILEKRSDVLHVTAQFAIRDYLCRLATRDAWNVNVGMYIYTYYTHIRQYIIVGQRKWRNFATMSRFVYLFSAHTKRILRAPCASIYEAVECIISRLMQLHASLARMVLRENGNRNYSCRVHTQLA